MNKNAFRDLSYGVYIVSTWDKGRMTGCTANSAMQITSDPATIAISINHDNYTNQCIRENGRFSLSILGENTDATLIGRFGFQSGKDVDKYEGVDSKVMGDLPIVCDACAYIVCEVIDQMETDTHTVFLGKVLDADEIKPDEAMTYSYYHKIIKGKSPKNAPTYIAEETDQEAIEREERYVCSICGYIYDGEIPFEQLPEDYTCPVCKQPKSKFEKK